MSNVLKKRLIIFDVDGTLVDSENDVFLGINHVLTTNVGIEVSREEFRKMAGLTLEQTFEGLLPEDKKELSKDFTAQYRQYYIDERHCLDTTKLFEGVADIIDSFKKQGFILAVASSKAKRALDPILEHLGLAEQFDLILATGATNVKHKPDPEIIYNILEELNVAPNDAVMVGDTRADILAGKNAGIDTIAITYGYEEREKLIASEPTYMIDEFYEIGTLITYRG